MREEGILNSKYPRVIFGQSFKICLERLYNGIRFAIQSIETNMKILIEALQETRSNYNTTLTYGRGY